LKLEDTRTLDDAALAALLKSAHPEVRRRAAQAIGRINKPEGRALLAAARDEANPDVEATIAFSTGQLKDADAVGWLASLLESNTTSPALAREAARSLGKIRTPEARTALARYLSAATVTSAAADVIGEALLSIGRFTTKED